MWTTWLNSQQAWHESHVLLNSKQNDLPDRQYIIHPTYDSCYEDIWLISDYTMIPLASDGCLRPNQKSIVVRTIAWAVTESRKRQQDTFEGRFQWKNTDKKYRIKRRQVGWQWSCTWALASDVRRYGSECAVGDKNKRSTNGHIICQLGPVSFWVDLWLEFWYFCDVIFVLMGSSNSGILVYFSLIYL